jgi:site-specific recombinase XerD
MTGRGGPFPRNPEASDAYAHREAFVAYLVAHGTTDASARSYARRLPSLEGKLHAAGASLLTASDVDLAAVFEGDAAALSPWTLRANWSALRRFYEFATATALRPDNPSDSLEVTRKPPRKPRPLPDPVHVLRSDEDLLANWPGVLVGFERFLVTAGKSQRTAFDYSQAMRRFGEWLRGRDLDPVALDAEVLRIFVAERLVRASRTRVHGEVVALRWFYTWLATIGRREDNPAVDLRVKRGTSVPTLPILPPAIKAMIAAATKDRDRLLILVLAHTGARIAEAASIRIEETDFEGCTFLLHGKGDKDRRVAVPAHVMALARSVAGERRAGPLFLSEFDAALTAHQLYKIVKVIADAAGVQAAPHRFRPGFAIPFLDDTGDVHALQKILGHASLATTQRYLTYRSDERVLAMMRASGMARLLSEP